MEPKRKTFIVEDDLAASETLKDSLGEGFEFGVFSSAEALHDVLLAGSRPDIAFVDIHLRTDPTAGFRVLELLRGLSPETIVCVLSADLGRCALRERLSSWPSLLEMLQKGEMAVRIPDLVQSLDKVAVNDTWRRGITFPPLKGPRVSVKEEVRRLIEPLSLDIEEVVRSAFPMDSYVDVVLASRGLSGATGLGVIVRSSEWRSQNAFYFLKIGRGDKARDEIIAELENYRCIRQGSANQAFFPKCYGIVKSLNFTILVYEYLGVARGGGADSQVVHFDQAFRELLVEGARGRNQLRRAFEPLGSLLRSSSNVSGRWIDASNREDLLRLCRKAARCILRRFGVKTTKKNIEAILGDRFFLSEDLVEIRLIDPENDKILNPIRRLIDLEIEAETDVLSLGIIHGDLHCRNLIRTDPSPEPHWMLIDFEHVRSGDLQMLDAARLECDLMFERLPLQSLEVSYQLARRVIFDAAGLTDPRWNPPVAAAQDIAPVERTLVALHDYMVTVFEERRRGGGVASIHRQYLYALLYESIRWLTHRATPMQFLQRLFYGAIICDALDKLPRDLAEVTH